MKLLNGIYKRYSLSDFCLSHGIYGRIALCLFFPIIISFSSCFRENVLQKVELYNSQEEASYYLQVLNVSPANGAIDIGLNSHIDAEFNDNINMLTVDASTFIVDDGSGPVTGTRTYDAALKTLTFTPTGGFIVGTTYTVTLTTGIQNMVGESMAADYSWSFSTVAASAPEIYILSPLGSEMFTGVTTYDFGTLLVSTTKFAVFTIGNSGSSNLSVTGTAFSGVNSAEFIVSVAPAASVIPGGTTTFTVMFQPNATPETKNAVLTITNSDADESSFAINLTGSALGAIAPEIQITKNGVILVSPVSTVDFGTLPAGGTGTIALVMHNIGTDDLVVSGFSFGGTNPDLFSTDFGAVPATITAGTTKSFNVSFLSPAKVNARAELIFHNNDTDEPDFVIKLKGRVK